MVCSLARSVFRSTAGHWFKNIQFEEVHTYDTPRASDVSIDAI